MTLLLIETLDWAVIGLYFALVFYIAFWANGHHLKKKTGGSNVLDAEGNNEKTSADYFLAGKNVGWFVIGASLFASNIGSEHLIGLAGAGARGDMPTANFEILATLILIVLGWIFVPFYLKSGVFTMPEFLEKRYSPAARTYLSVISIVAYVLTKISVTIFAGALVFEVMLGIPFWTGAILVVLATGVYTILGGLRAVIYTDMMQMFVLIGGAIAVTFFGLQAIGGWGEVVNTVYASTPDGSKFFNLWRPGSDTSYPWTGIIFGAPILGVWYWCTDQFIVQRVLSAHNLSEARKGTIFAGFLKLLPLFLFVIPGIIAYALSVENTTLLHNSEGVVDYDAALPALVMNYLPVGFKGLVAAGLLAALMSSLSSVFNSCSTLFTIDFYKKRFPEATEQRLVRTGQIATAVLVVTGLAWIPFMKTMMEGEGIFKYLQSIQAYISPPIAAVFLLGLFMKRLNAKGAMAALWTGFAIGATRLILEYLVGSETLIVADNSFIAQLVGINFLHFAVIMFVICAAVLVGMSLTAPAYDEAKLANVTYSSEVAATENLLANKDFWLTIILIGLVIVLWIVFSPLGIA